MRYLSEEVYLPNFQKLAAKGITFQKAFAQQALCAPSRNSILTGRRPDELRLYDFYNYWRDTVGNFSTFPQIFKEHGYDTYSAGKIFHPGKSSNFTDDYPYSWTLKPYHPPTEKYKDDALCKDRHSITLHKNLICPINVKEQPDNTLPDLETLKYSIDIIKNRNQTKPFLLAVGFHKPHIPLKYPHKYLKNVPISSVNPPRVSSIPKGLPLVSWHPWTDVRRRDDIKKLNLTFPFGIMPPKWTLKIRQSYYAASLYIDDLLGKLMSHVNQTNTIIVVTSDHGWSLGENGLWAKYSNFDVALRVPLLFKIPGFQPKVITNPVELVDIYPTLLEVGLNIFVPKCKNNDDKSTLCSSGKSLVQLMSNKHNTGRSFAISQYPRPQVQPTKSSDKPKLKDIKIMGYSIRTEKYRYTEWISFNNTHFTRNWNKIHGIELYNHVYDDEESNNLYLVPYYQDIKKQLSALLRSTIN
ncbi:putative iduronate 2-sulfatase [Danaus plexippus plexippus]|uniref:Iduronate 2-sulfatase n=1 Tax=Danaus plexippus plexippus TaxID=278856 RepID=A0A212ESD8_DANPL|nr:putative iduronate 2-sulfatase [Danaus plexippus plexippus]